VLPTSSLYLCLFVLLNFNAHLFYFCPWYRWQNCSPRLPSHTFPASRSFSVRSGTTSTQAHLPRPTACTTTVSTGPPLSSPPPSTCAQSPHFRCLYSGNTSHTGGCRRCHRLPSYLRPRHEAVHPLRLLPEVGFRQRGHSFPQPR
jgi:hypothetical protein